MRKRDAEARGQTRQVAADEDTGNLREGTAGVARDHVDGVAKRLDSVALERVDARDELLSGLMGGIARLNESCFGMYLTFFAVVLFLIYPFLTYYYMIRLMSSCQYVPGECEGVSWMGVLTATWFALHIQLTYTQKS